MENRVIETGNRIISLNLFESCSDIKKVVLIEEGKITLKGTTVEEVIIDKENDVLFRKQELIFLDPNMANRTVNLKTKWSTLEPITCSDKGNKNLDVRYDLTEIEVRIENEEKDMIIRHEREEGVFDLFSVELLLRILPLEIGYHFELRAFNHMENETITVKIDVLKLECITNGLEEVDAWEVNVFFGENLQKYWISKDKKELLKQSIKLGEDVFFDFVR